MRTIDQIQTYIVNASVSLADYWTLYIEKQADGDPNTEFLKRRVGIIKLYIVTIQSYIDNQPEEIETINSLFNSLLSYLPSNFLTLSYAVYNPLPDNASGVIVISSVVKASNITYGIVILNVAPVNGADPVALGANDPRIANWDSAYALAQTAYDARIVSSSFNSAGNLVLTVGDTTTIISDNSVILNQSSVGQSASMWITGTARIDGQARLGGLTNTGAQPNVLVADANGNLHKRTIAEFAGDINIGSFTANRAIISNGAGVLTASSVTDTELGRLSGVTSNIQTQLNNKQPLDATLTALAAYNTNGFLVQTAADTFAGRTLQGQTNRIDILNASGVAGNPIIDISATYIGQNTITTLGTITTGTWTASAIADAYIASSSVWNTAYANMIVSASFNTSTGLLTLTQQDAGSVTANLDGRYLLGNQTITLSGEASGSGATSIAVTLDNAAVIGKVLTGYVSGAGTVAATDTILQAIQKLNGNIAAVGASSITIGTTNITLGGTALSLAGLTSVTSTSFTGSLIGNASTATALQTARTINGVSFNGTANITVTAAAGTLTGTALNSTVVSSSLTSVGTITTGVWQATAVADAYIASSANWNTAYNNRIATFTTTGNSGAATFTGNTLNIPNYTLAGLGGVPYTGATSDVNLGEQGIKAGYVAYDLTPTSTPTTQGTTYWDATEETVTLIMNGAKQHVGLDTFYNVKNSTGTTIPKGTAVRFAGTDGGSGHLLIAPFLADGTYPSTYYMGVTAEDIATGDFGKVMQFGKLRGIDTSTFTNGDILYASATVAGGFQTTAPVAPNNIVIVAAVVNASNNGTLVVRATLGSNINNDEGVKITSPATGQLLQLQASGLWENKTLAAVLGGTSAQFVKGDGSLDSNVYLTGNQTITLSGEASGSGATSINVTLANSAVISKVLTGLSITGGAITASDTILSAFGKVQNQINGLMGGVIYKGTYNASTNTPTLSDGTGSQGWYYVVNVAGTQNFGSGSISFNVGDWAIYNGSIWEKVDNTDSVTSVNGQIGAVVLTTSDITEGTNLYYTNARGIGSTLTGYVSGAGTITAADSILSAIQKLNGNVSALVTGVSSVSGTSNRITVSPTSGAVVVDIASNYAGQNTITTLGTIGTGVWQGTAIGDTYIASSATWNAKIGGSGTTNYIPKFTASGAIGNSIMNEVGTTINVGGFVKVSSGAFNAGGVLFDYSSNASSRSWKIKTDENAFGDFIIQQSTTQTGATYANILSLTSSQLTTFGATGSEAHIFGGSARVNGDMYVIGGNVGIGTTSPSEKLEVQNGTAGARIKASNTGGGSISFGISSNATSVADITFSNSLSLMGGNVGIGTTNPAFKLDVNGTANFTGNVEFAGIIYSDTLQNYAGGTTPLTLKTSGGQNIVIQTNSTERILVASNGQIITNSANNTSEAHIFGGSARVNGTLGVTGAATFSSTLAVTDGFSWGTSGNKYMYGTGGTQKFAYTITNHNILYVGGSTGLSIYNSSDTTSLVRFLDNGNVGIGTTSPASKFVISNAGAEGMEFGYSVGLSANYIQSINRSTFAATDFAIYVGELGANIKFYTETVQRMTIKNNGVINMSSLPTSSAGLSAGDIWSDDSVLRIGTSGTGFIKNQSASAQTASMWITGEIKTNSNAHIRGEILKIGTNTNLQLSANGTGFLNLNYNGGSGGVRISDGGGSAVIMSITPTNGLTVLNSLIVNATIDTDRFLVSDNGTIKYRTGAQVLSDIGGASATGGTGYIQNQIASAQSASMWIDGTIKTEGDLYIGANGAYISEYLVGSTYELRVFDSAGNATVFSPHNFSKIPNGRSEEMAWSFYSERHGKYINVDMLKVVRLVESLTEEQLVFIGDV